MGDPIHRTSEVRDIAVALRDTHKQNLFCVWTGKRLTAAFEIDHCLPFAIWPNNDLWNLLPSDPAVNLRKLKRLVSAATLHKAAPRIQDWWDRAYLQRNLQPRFLSEASTALPLVRLQTTSPPLDRVLAGLELQRSTLRRNQQLKEWAPLG